MTILHLNNLSFFINSFYLIIIQIQIQKKINSYSINLNFKRFFTLNYKKLN